MTGKEKCRILRQIREKIARDNDLPFTPEACDYEGDDCTGTCPMCEQELQMLEAALAMKRKLDLEVAIKQYNEDLLQFQSRSQEEAEDDLNEDDLIIETPLFPEMPEPDLHMLLLKLSRAGIVSLKEVQTFTPEELRETCGMTDQELEDLAQLLQSRGLLWRKGPRNPNRQRLRGRMRSTYGYF